MQRWQAGPLVWMLIAVLPPAACGDGARPDAGPGVPDASLDSSPLPDAHDLAPPVEAPDVARPAIDAPPADGPRPGAAPDVPLSACLLVAQVNPGTPGLPAGPEDPTIGDPSKLSPQEIVGRLARFIWRSEPDADLLARVQGCMRLTVADVLALADLMLHDPRAARGIQAFVVWWLELDRLAAEQRNPASFPPLTAELRLSMAEEVRLFASNVVFNDTGTLPRLLTAPYSFIDRQLAAIYGVPAVDDSFRRVDFRAEHQRSGILTMPGVLAVSGGFERHSGPVRGKRLLDRLMCVDVPPPPPMATPVIPPESQRPGESLRQAMEKTIQDPACRGCHALLEVGFALEPFDAIGRHRTTDNGVPIDASARLSLPEDGFADVSGPPSLGRTLAEAAGMRRCFAKRWLEFAFGRRLERLDDQVLINAVNNTFVQSNLAIRALIAQITVTVPFLAPN